MNLRVFTLLTAFGFASGLQAAPNFWTVPGATPTPPAAPQIQEQEQPSAYNTATPTPVTVPMVQYATKTPTPQPGLRAINPTEAAIFSAIVPGSGQVYAGDPARGLVFAALFGVGLWQTIYNFQLVTDSTGNVGSRNEDVGNLVGLATLAVYGFGIQDAYSTAANFNKKHYLTLNFGITPRPSAQLAYRF